ncbi:MAG: D-cysteine desulfhydrase family protein [Pseudomonadota bacterium]
MNRQALTRRLESIPQVRLAHLPTPLERCPRLTQHLNGPQIWVKRDDLTGLAFGGNKTRQLEFLFADIVATGADVVVAGAFAQSNWCRQITAAACRLGIDASLVLAHGEKGPYRQGNLLVDELLGAEITIVDLDDIQRLPPFLHEKVAALRQAGRNPYLIDPFAPDTLALSTLGYVKAAIELDAQLEATGADADYVYLSGANMTPAGLMLGLRALGRKTKVVSISPIAWEEDRAIDIARIANNAAKLLDLDVYFDASEVTALDEFIGQRYGVVSDAGRAALHLAAETEGLILDPVYSSKAMAGMIEHIRVGRLSANDSVIFVHTGGNPAVFAYADELQRDAEHHALKTGRAT